MLNSLWPIDEDGMLGVGEADLTHWPLRDTDLIVILRITFKLISRKYLEHFLWNCLRVNATGPHWWSVNICLGIGLLHSGNEHFPKPMLTKFYDAIWCHWPQWVECYFWVILCLCDLILYFWKPYFVENVIFCENILNTCKYMYIAQQKAETQLHMNYFKAWQKYHN